MPNKQISQLDFANPIQTADLFVLEQSGSAKKLEGGTLIQWVTSYADGHGGIQSIAKTGSAGTPVVDTYTITYADGNTSTFTVTNGAKGDTGNSWYVWIKYASQEPTPSHPDIGDAPDKWMGIYSGTASTAPATYTSYTWYEIKGDIGTPSSLTSAVVDYQSGTTGTVVPSGSWSSSVPIVAHGDWLWTRITLTFNTGSPVVFYTASRQGVDGEGAAGSATPLLDINGGAVGTSTAFSRQDHRHPVPTLHLQYTITSLPTSFSDSSILSTMRVINCEIGTPNAITSDIAWSTSDGSIALSGTLATSGSTTIDLDLAIF